ncbi:SIALI-17 repeat-containing surface protein, partial [Dolosigranulum pigrum]|uniref:SIALI-17 repeat-containing surface protein n=1 Tax=Dolosigranulum pigrum TaxID=29394 RepID=UPI000DBF87ED
ENGYRKLVVKLVKKVEAPKPQPKPQPEQPDVPSEEAETKEFLFQYEIDGNRNGAELFQGNRVELASHVLKQVEARHPGYEVESQVWEEENGYRKLVVKLVKKVDSEEEAGRELDAAKAEALTQIAELEYFTAKEKEALVDRINEYDNLGDVDFIVTKAIEQNDDRHQAHRALLEGKLQGEDETLPPAGKPGPDAGAEDLGVVDPEEEAGRELDAAKAEALAQIAELEYFTAKEKEALVDRINEYDNLGDVDFIVTKAIEQNDDRHQAHRALLEGKLQGEDETLPPAGKPGPDAGAEDLGVVDPEEEAGRELDAAKAEALTQIAELEYFTAKEKEALVDRINEYDNLGDVDFIVTKAIEQNDDRHQAHRALLEGKLQGEDETLPEIGKPNDANKDNYAKDFALAAYKEQVIDELKSKGFNNDFVFSAIRRANTVKGIDSLIAELDLPEGQPEIEDAFKTYKEAKIAELEAKGFEGNSLLGKLRNAKTREGFDNLLALLEAQLKDNVQPPVVDKPEFEGGVNHYEGLVNRKPEFPFDQLLKLYKEKVIEDLKEQDFHNDFVFDQIERAKTIEGINSLIENLDVKNALLNKAKAGAAEDIRELTAFSKEEKEELIAKVFSYDNVGDIDFIVTKVQQLNDERLKDHDKAIEDQIEGEDETLPETGKPNDTDADDIFGSKLDKAKTGALEDIAGLDYFTADEKAKLEDLVNEVESFDEFVEKVDKAISEAIEENDKRHKAAQSSEEKPGDKEEQKPGKEEQKPGKEEQKPGKEEEKPGEEEQKPGKEEQKPGKEEQKPGKEEQKPGQKESDKGQLQSAKDNAKGEIDKLPNLSDKQKGDLKAGLDKADSLAKVQEILDFARKLNKDQAPKQ